MILFCYKPPPPYRQVIDVSNYEETNVTHALSIHIRSTKVVLITLTIGAAIVIVAFLTIVAVIS